MGSVLIWFLGIVLCFQTVGAWAISKQKIAFSSIEAGISESSEFVFPGNSLSIPNIAVKVCPRFVGFQRVAFVGGELQGCLAEIQSLQSPVNLQISHFVGEHPFLLSAPVLFFIQIVWPQGKSLAGLQDAESYREEHNQGWRLSRVLGVKSEDGRLLFSKNYSQPSTLTINKGVRTLLGSSDGIGQQRSLLSNSAYTLPGRVSGLSSVFSLFGNSEKSQDDSPCCRSVGPSEEAIPTWEVPFGIFYVFLGMIFIRFSGKDRTVLVCGFLCGILGGLFILGGYVNCQPKQHSEYRQVFQHDGENVAQVSLAVVRRPVRASGMAKHRDFSGFSIVPLWVAIMSGLLSLVREFVATFYPNKVSQSGLFSFCCWTAFVISAGGAWWIEHQKLSKEMLKNEGSRIEGQIALVFADSKKGAEDGSGFELLRTGCYLSALLSATNVNPAPAYLDRNATTFSIEIGGKTHFGQWVPLQMGRVDFIAINAALMNGNIFDFFSPTFGKFPMEDGAPRTGWMRFFFPDLNESTLRKLADVPQALKITLIDSRRKPHAIPATLKIQFGVLYRTEVVKT
ncbi:MAG TPA: hypothetical protein VMF56_10420 [Acidobacteriaceae bacterium]|nr:hypothetical protein [Acidobacteriaceae bacterium]